VQDRRQFNNLVGSFLEDSLKKALKTFEFSVQNHKVYQNGVDAQASLKNLKTVWECWNWDRNSYANSERLRKIMKNFQKHPDSLRFLVMSHNLLTKEQQRIMKSLGVKIIIIGEQLYDCGKQEILKLLRVLYILLRDYLEIDTLTTCLDRKMVLEGYPELTSSNFPVEEETEINPYTLETIQKPNSPNVSSKGDDRILSQTEFNLMV
jgi:hypothetical protein